MGNAVLQWPKKCFGIFMLVSAWQKITLIWRISEKGVFHLLVYLIYIILNVLFVFQKIYITSLLKMREAGLFEFWETQSMAADPTPCLKTRRNSKQSKLTIGGLSGSFIVLSIGIILSLFVFITETFFKCCCNVLAKSANPKG